jgi:hypothetical protein
MSRLRLWLTSARNLLYHIWTLRFMYTVRNTTAGTAVLELAKSLNRRRGNEVPTVLLLPAIEELQLTVTTSTHD